MCNIDHVGRETSLREPNGSGESAVQRLEEPSSSTTPLRKLNKPSEEKMRGPCILAVLQKICELWLGNRVDLHPEELDGLLVL